MERPWILFKSNGYVTGCAMGIGLYAVVFMGSLVWHDEYKSDQIRERFASLRERDDILSFDIGGIPFYFVHVEGGRFKMGNTPEQVYEDERIEKLSDVVRDVRMTDYWISLTEVTMEQWRAVMDGEQTRNMKPVGGVSFNQASRFAQRLNKLHPLDSLVFRLPTEAEWEYAARGGNKSRHYRYSGGNDIDDVARSRRNSTEGRSGHKCSFVASYRPNELGIYDMSGNMMEWCLDGNYQYWTVDTVNPYAKQMDDIFGRKIKVLHVLRGGGYDCKKLDLLNVSARFYLDKVWDEMGMRLVINIPADSIYEKGVGRLMGMYTDEKQDDAEEAWRGQEDKLPDLCQMLAASLLHKMTYPEEAMYIGMGGVVKARFRTARGGRIDDVNLVGFTLDSKCLWKEATGEQNAKAVSAMRSTVLKAVGGLRPLSELYAIDVPSDLHFEVTATFEYTYEKCYLTVRVRVT